MNVKCMRNICVIRWIDVSYNDTREFYLDCAEREYFHAEVRYKDALIARDNSSLEKCASRWAKRLRYTSCTRYENEETMFILVRILSFKKGPVFRLT